MKWIQKSAVNGKRSDLVALVISIAILVLLMVLLSLVYLKIDLTAEKRHTLTPGTIKLLSELDDHMFVRCYLHGEFPAEFKKLEQSIQERLEEFNDYSNGLIDYEFIDPYADGDAKRVEENVSALLEKGLRYTNIKMQENGAQLEKRIFPGIIVEYKGMEYPISLFRAEKPIVSQVDLTNAIQGSLNQLEYQLANGLKKIARSEKPAVAVLTGHGEIDRLNLADFIFGLSENYAVEQVKLEERLNALNDKVDGVSSRKNRYAALVIAGTDTMVGDKDRFIIDQFIMNGGKVLWMLDALKMNLDSLAMAQTSTAVENTTGLSPMLYQYGVRLNNTLIADFESAPIYLESGEMGQQKSYVERRNYYFPIFQSAVSNVITNNLDPIRMEFPASLDSVNPNPEIQKIPLFWSSELSKEFRAPARVDLAMLSFNQDYFKVGNAPRRITAMLLEGRFPSAFQNNLPAVIRNDAEVAYAEKSQPTRMIVIADADVARNEVQMDQGRVLPLPLGYDGQFGRVVYDNKEFLMNCMNYLLDDADLINIRSRTIEIRLLDKSKTTAYAVWIQVTNIGAPLLLLALLGGIMHIYRNRWKRPLRGK